MSKNKILGITIPKEPKKQVLEKIIKYIHSPKGFFHIVSLNPEIFILAEKNYEFKKVVETAQIKTIDGVGIVIASRLLGVEAGDRLTGVDLMDELIKQADELRLRVLLIGGKQNLALDLVDCYKDKYPEASFFGTIGIKDIKNPKKEEENEIFSIVRRHKPHLIFAAFGSPDQELWLARHSKELSGIVCMGVGGSFDFLSGKINRAPLFLQKIGMEWLFRLVKQPWRWRRQLRLLYFAYLVIREKWTKN